MIDKNAKTLIVKAVRDYFGHRRYVYINPNTPSFTFNYYGDTYICKLSRQDVIARIEHAYVSWYWYGSTDALQDAIKTTIADLQYNRPKQDSKLTSRYAPNVRFV